MFKNLVKKLRFLDFEIKIDFSQNKIISNSIKSFSLLVNQSSLIFVFDSPEYLLTKI